MPTKLNKLRISVTQVVQVQFNFSMCTHARMLTHVQANTTHMHTHVQANTTHMLTHVQANTTHMLTHVQANTTQQTHQHNT